MNDDQTLDAILDGKVRLKQKRGGHRVGADAILLASAAGAEPRRFVDVGAGVGAVGLILLARWPSTHGVLLEIDPTAADLARQNATLNAAESRAHIIEADVLDRHARRTAGLANGEADLVMTNPPFFAAGAVRASPDASRARAHVFASDDDDPLEAWIAACLALLTSGGRFQMIHRADALALALAAIGTRLGAIAVRPIYPREGADAIRILIGGVKGSKAPLRLLPGVALHEADGTFTPLAAALHRGDALL